MDDLQLTYTCQGGSCQVTRAEIKLALPLSDERRRRKGNGVKKGERNGGREEKWKRGKEEGRKGGREEGSIGGRD